MKAKYFKLLYKSFCSKKKVKIYNEMDNKNNHLFPIGLLISILTAFSDILAWHEQLFIFLDADV